MEKEEIKCIFCEKDMSNEKFRTDYTLIAWLDDPEEPDSLNKVAQPAHQKCFKRFIELNFQAIKGMILSLIG